MAQAIGLGKVDLALLVAANGDLADEPIATVRYVDKPGRVNSRYARLIEAAIGGWSVVLVLGDGVGVLGCSFDPHFICPKCKMSQAKI